MINNFSKFLIFILILFPIISFAGRVEGPGNCVAHIEPHGVFIVSLDLKTKEPTIFICQGVGGDSNYYVYDIHGKIIAKDEDPESDCIIIFTPTRYGLHSIKVINNSSEASYVFIRVN